MTETRVAATRANAHTTQQNAIASENVGMFIGADCVGGDRFVVLFKHRGGLWRLHIWPARHFWTSPGGALVAIVDSPRA